MECFVRPLFKYYTRTELEQISFENPSEEYRKKVLDCWDCIAKPLDGMGEFEKLTAQIGAITHTEEIDISKKAVIIMCADNGIVEEGISQSGQEVTLAVTRAMGKKQSSVCKMARRIGADTIPVDIGINTDQNIENVYDRKIRAGTRNFRKEPAMTEAETIRAIVTGMDIVQDCKKNGYQILATGEMGIGNTTTSSAVAAALLRCEAAQVTGRGAGLSAEGLCKKQRIIEEAIAGYDLYHADALTILQTVGGLDIAGLVGVCIGGACYHVPIVLDGVISMTAALLAERICPGVKAYLLASHRGKEPAVYKLERELGVEPVINAGMALGEGTGAVMMFSLLDIALSIYQTKTTFADIRIEQYERML